MRRPVHGTDVAFLPDDIFEGFASGCILKLRVGEICHGLAVCILLFRIDRHFDARHNSLAGFVTLTALGPRSAKRGQETSTVRHALEYRKKASKPSASF